MKQTDAPIASITPIVPLFLILLLMIGCATAKIVGGPIASDHLRDGLYDGVATNGPVKAKVTVAIRNQRLADIKLVAHRNWRGRAADRIIPKRIIEEQSTRVDAVSGATASSYAIMNAVEDAVRKAKVQEE